MAGTDRYLSKSKFQLVPSLLSHSTTKAFLMTERTPVSSSHNAFTRWERGMPLTVHRRDFWGVMCAGMVLRVYRWLKRNDRVDAEVCFVSSGASDAGL